MRDDQFLVSDRTENKFYGSLHAAGSTASTGGVVGSTVGPSLGYIGRRLQVRQSFGLVYGFYKGVYRLPLIYVLQFFLGWTQDLQLKNLGCS